MRQKPIVIIGAGLAGSEAAKYLSQRKIQVDLFEMRPQKMTEAHTGSHFSELVCSNSFGSTLPDKASGILKTELTLLNAYILKIAQKHAVPAGASLAIDRERFSSEITKTIECSPYITIHRSEITEIPKDRICILASGPLTSPALSASLSNLVGGTSLYFYDAISPIVSFDSLNLDRMFWGNRYQKGETQDFLNIPLNKEEYNQFVEDLLSSEMVLPHQFEEEKHFESCMPIESLAQRGKMTLAYGPMKPVGFIDPKTGKRPFAIIQLRTENSFKTAFNLVGFQTKLKYKEQEKVFRKLPGLEKAEFLRLGSMHRNTFIDSPRLLLSSLQLRNTPNIFIAGQLTGTEGYLESSATGLWAAMNAEKYYFNKPITPLPTETMLGSLLAAITDPNRKNFQPLNSNLGILPPLEEKISDKKLRNEKFAFRSKLKMSQFIECQSEWSPEDYKLAVPLQTPVIQSSHLGE